MLKTKFFRKIEKVLDYVSEKTVIFYSKYRRLLAQLDKQFGKAEEVLLNYQEIKRLHRNNYS
jgi:hypothetical protein